MIPDGMPVLSAGAHPYGPKTGACVMEYVSLLAGEEWTDSPKCTLPILAHEAWVVNDYASDKDRQRLLPLIPRLIGTGRNHLPNGDRTRVQVALNTWKIAHRHHYPDPIDFLAALIDEFDRLTGRTAPAPLTDGDLARLAAATR